MIHHSRPDVNYRYFVVQHGDKFKLLGSCNEVRAISPMTRCLVKIYHQYDFFQMDINEMKGTGVIIHKSNDYILIVTAFHVIVPQFVLTFNQFIILYLVTLIGFLVSWYFKLHLSMVKLFIPAMLYALLYCGFWFLSLAFFYPMLCASSFQVEPAIGNSENQFSSMDFECQVISNTQTFSRAWWEDVGIMKCSKINAHFYQYFEVCIPTAFNSTAFLSNDNTIAINVIGYVGTAPASFDLIVDPLVYLRASLKSILVVNGKTPTEIMLANTFANCTGKLRFFDQRKLFIDTPATFGFSGGLCYLQSNRNEWEFIGILLGTTKLWNYCISLTTTSTYTFHENLFQKKQEL